MGIFDIKNTDIFSKDYDENGESFDESDENNFWDYLKKNK